jgi:tetratricopeptide (TPR) repeat protein
MTVAIEKAEKDYNARQSDAKAKEKLGEAYFTRAFALTEAAQYRAALGDFRKGLKLKPDDKDAKAMHDRIISIFQSINREPPKEGEEPPPMPFNKGS